MQITQIHAREVYDSRGFPTVACDLCLQDGTWVTAMVPSGASVGTHEALELRDGGPRLCGKGVLKAIENIYRIAPQFVGREINAIDMDQELLALDASPQKSSLGANATLAVSMALFKGHAQALGIELYDFIARSLDYDELSLPVPLFNMLNGGRHASNGLSVQEYLIIPAGARSFEQAMEIGAEVFHALKSLLHSKGKSTCTGDEGGFAPSFANSIEPLEYLLNAIHKAGFNEQDVVIGLDVAASELFDDKKKGYRFDGKLLTSEQMLAWYANAVNDYPIASLEDPFAQEDWVSWISLKRLIGRAVRIVGDDLLVTNVDRIVQAAERDAANAVIIKPNQIGTVSEAIAAVLQAQEFGWQVIVSHRSGETTDTFIADFALGVRAHQVKFGGCSHGERLAKYNRLLQIEFYKNLMGR